MSWLKELLTQTKEYESPPQFWYWAGLSALSAIVKDKVWVERVGGLTVYLNIYVLFFARSGLRKGPPINLAKKLVKKIGNTRVISGRSSVEAIIDDLKEVQTDKETRIILADSCGFITASEFSSALVKSESALDILTDFYDRKYNEGEYNIRLVRTGKQTLKSPTLTLLGGINEAHFENFMENKDIGGGFLGRTFIIYADEKGKPNSLMWVMENEINEEVLLEHLRLVEKLKGPMRIIDEGKKIYDGWYREFYSNKIEDKTGTYERVGDSVLKIAGLLSLAEGLEMEISERNILDGIQLAEKLIHSARHVTYTLHEEQSISTLKKKIIKILIKREDHKITRQRLLSELHGVMNSEDLNKIAETLEQAGLISAYVHGDNVFYKLKEDVLEKFSHMLGKEE